MKALVHDWDDEPALDARCELRLTSSATDVKTPISSHPAVGISATAGVTNRGRPLGRRPLRR
jgi:hypothetical protein